MPSVAQKGSQNVHFVLGAHNRNIIPAKGKLVTLPQKVDTFHLNRNHKANRSNKILSSIITGNVFAVWQLHRPLYHHLNAQEMRKTEN
jgi:hypothetical protein